MTGMGDRFVAVDWGTTNRRAFLIENGAVLRTDRDACGILGVGEGGFPAAVAELRARFDGLPLLLAGMVGSNRGWVDAGYVPCPATLEALAAALVRPEEGVAVVPGVSQLADGRADVMRGEEVQFLGAVAGGLVPADALLAQPGTHNKWARLSGGAITGFTTAMTGEMFGLLRRHALIGSAMTGDVADGPAFRHGVADAQGGDLLARLFGVRPASLLGVRDDADAAAYVSGLLIGSDCACRLSEAGGTVYLLADEDLGSLYRVAIEAAGGTAVRVDSHAAFVAGVARIWELVR